MDVVGDELAQCRELFCVGYYSRCLEVAEFVHSSIDYVALEKQTLQAQARACLGQLTDEAVQDLMESQQPALRAVGLAIIHGRPSSDEKVRRDAYEELKQLSMQHDSTAKFLAACILSKQDEPAQAMDTLSQNTLEMQALRVFVLLQMDRVDLAEKILLEMTALNDDSSVTKVASAWLNIYQGNYQEAYLTYNDIQSQCCEGEEPEGGSSLLLLNGKAVANLYRRQWQEADEDLRRALQQDPHCVDALANGICCAQNRRRPKEAADLYATLEGIKPDHPMVVKRAQLSHCFASFEQQAADGRTK
eukprot:GHVS01105155.1.p1 GENE.GHVS01105155.1~~GHVS01105155.1.p1  ORF type:complete len:304 (+),score=38.62 GHVS01105155.1:138-1049(+)